MFRKIAADSNNNWNLMIRNVFRTAQRTKQVYYKLYIKFRDSGYYNLRRSQTETPV